MQPRLWIALFLITTAALRAESSAPADGVSIFICGHSFHLFIQKPLEALAKEAGFTAHHTAGTSMIGGSRVMQHWELPDEKNTAKHALETGKVDVLTLAPHVQIPDPGIDRFADLAFEHNPNIRVMVQISWPAEPLKTNWDQMPFLFAAYMAIAQQQVDAINARHGRDFVSFVPVAQAFFQLREAILAGQVPGITHFAELFKDPLGHPKPPLENLVTFCWFAAIYHRSPEGLTALDSPATPVSAETNRVLQKIAWDAVQAEQSSDPNLKKVD